MRVRHNIDVVDARLACLGTEILFGGLVTQTDAFLRRILLLDAVSWHLFRDHVQVNAVDIEVFLGITLWLCIRSLRLLVAEEVFRRLAFPQLYISQLHLQALFHIEGILREPFLFEVVRWNDCIEWRWNQFFELLSLPVDAFLPLHLQPTQIGRQTRLLSMGTQVLPGTCRKWAAVGSELGAQWEALLGQPLVFRAMGLPKVWLNYGFIEVEGVRGSGQLLFYFILDPLSWRSCFESHAALLFMLRNVRS